MDQRVSRVSRLCPVRSKVREVLYELRVRPLGKVRVSVDKQLYSNPLSFLFCFFHCLVEDVDGVTGKN